MENKESKSLYNQLLDGNESALVEFYENNKSEFINFFKKYNINEESLLDMYQDSVIVIYQKIVCEHFELKSSSLKTYLFGIGKRKLLNVIRNKHEDEYDESLESSFYTDFIDPFEIPDEQRLLAEAIKKLGNPCDQLLQMFYYDNYSGESIANRMGYKNESVVRTQKLRCLHKLREIWANLKN